MIYLDNSATTKVDERVLETMLPFLKEQFGNPSSKYYKLAQTAEEAVKEARAHVAALINADPDEILFTSGATESNNFILKGVADHYHTEGNHIITSAIEHKSIMDTCHYLEDKGYKVTYIQPDQQGKIPLKKLAAALTDKTILISIIWGNNELGTLNNIQEIAKIAQKNSILFHTDATQVVGKVEVNTKKIPFDFLSLSSHKIYGPKGIGITYIKKDDLGFRTKLTPLLHGGEQEYNLRAGTLPVHNIVGLGKAAELAKKEMKQYIPDIVELENYFKEKIKAIDSDITLNGDQNEKIPGIINLTIPGINNEFFIKEIKDEVAISTGSACSITEPSHVLKAIGLNESEIMATLRVSISKYNTQNDIDKLINCLSLYIH